MSNDELVQNEIEFISGSTNILLVAPHGYLGDDDNTGVLTRLVAEQSGCYAIINEFYQKSENDVNQEVAFSDSDIDDTAHEQNKRVDLNRFTEVKLHLENEFLNPLITYKNEIKKKFGHAIILWIHGAEDTSVEGDINTDSDIKQNTVKALIGFGQHRTITARHTADSKIINQLKAGLTANGLTALEADVQNNKFCAYSANNMNQLFRYGKKFYDSNVDSVQLELRMTGILFTPLVDSVIEGMKRQKNG